MTSEPEYSFDGEDFALEVLNESILQADSVSVSVLNMMQAVL